MYLESYLADIIKICLRNEIQFTINLLLNILKKVIQVMSNQVCHQIT